MDCSAFPVAPPKVVAVATDKYLTPTHSFADPELPGKSPMYGQDITFGTGRTVRTPWGAMGPMNATYGVGTTEADLKPKMLKLLKEFAHEDTTGMAKRLFTAFLAKQTEVTYFRDSDLDAAAAAHENIIHFCDAALGASVLWAPLHAGGPLHPLAGKPPAPGKTRIHQALKTKNWDIGQLVAPTDLGVPAFNIGDKYTKAGFGASIGDFATGLGVMINGVQHAYAVATHYRYDATQSRYCITLKFIFYDVFGLDDDDLKEYGTPGATGTDAAEGITAWWQLQHQHRYAPLVTRVVVERTYEVMAI